MGREIMSISSQRVPISPDIVRRLGNNVSAAYYYSQLLYYNHYGKKDIGGWFNKSSKEVEDDLGIGRRQQEHSRSLLEERGWIKTTTTRGGIRPGTKFLILVDLSRKTA